MLFGFCFGASSTINYIVPSASHATATNTYNARNIINSSYQLNLGISSSSGLYKNFSMKSNVNVFTLINGTNIYYGEFKTTTMTNTTKIAVYGSEPMPPVVKVSTLDQLEANATCPMDANDIKGCLMTKLVSFTTSRPEWYLLWVFNVLVLVVAMGLFVKSRLIELVMKKNKIRTKNIWVKASFASILPIILLNFLLLLNAESPTTCTYLPSIMGLAISCILIVNLMCLMRILLRIVILKPKIVLSKKKLNELGDIVESGDKSALFIDVVVKVAVIVGIILELIISASMENTYPFEIGKITAHDGVAYLMTCRPSDITNFATNYFIPKGLVLCALFGLSVFLNNNPQYFATSKLDDVPEAKEDITLALKTSYFSFI